MPLLKPSTDWARGIAKSLRKHLRIKVIKKRFSNKVHVYASSSGEGSTPSTTANPPLPSAKPTKKPKSAKKSKKSLKKSKPEKQQPPPLLVSSVGVQASLPCRSLLEELSHEGNINIMSYLGDPRNTNSNNSVDRHRQAQQAITSRVPTKSSSSRRRISSKPISDAFLPNKVTPKKSSKSSKSSTTGSGSGIPPTYQYPTHVCDASTNTSISSPPAPLSGLHHDTTSSTSAGIKSHRDISSSHAKTQRTTSTASPSLSKHHHGTTSPSTKSHHNTTSVSSSSQTTHTPRGQSNASTSLSKQRQHASTKTSSSVSSQTAIRPTTPTYRYSTAQSTYGHPTASAGFSLSEHLHRQIQLSSLATRNQTSVSKPRHRTSSTSQPIASYSDASSSNLRRHRSLTDVNALLADTATYSFSRHQEHASSQAISSSHTTSHAYRYGSTNISTSLPPYPDHRLSDRHLSTTGSITSSYARSQPNASHSPTHGTSSMPPSPSGSHHYGHNTAQSSLPTYSRHDSTTTTQSRSITTRSQPNASTDAASSSLAKHHHHRSPTHGSSSTQSPSRSHRDRSVSPSPPSPPPSYFSRHHSTPPPSAALTTKSQPNATTVTDTPGFSLSKHREYYASTMSTTSAPSSYTHTSTQSSNLSKRRTRSGSVSTSNPAKELAEKRVQSPSSPPTAASTGHEFQSRRLQRSNSTSSVADCMKWEEKKNSPDVLSSGNTLGKKSSRGRIKSLLNRSSKRTNEATQVQTSDNAMEKLFLEGGLVGLANLGNTCYMNSMLQCLSHTLEMTQIFLHPHFTTTKPLTKAYCQLMKDLWQKTTPLSITTNTYSSGGSNTYPSFYPGHFKHAVAMEYPQYSGNDQHDAQEFMRFLVSGLHDQMKREISRKYDPFVLKDETSSHQQQAEKAWHTYRQLEDSFISEVFMGQLKSTLQCSVCKGASVTFDPFWDICLPIPSLKLLRKLHDISLTDCIREFTREEVLDGDEKPVCASCGKAQRSIKRMTIQRFPPVLVLMLKRFTGYHYRSKLDTDVGIPQTLDLSPYASDDVKGQPAKYELYATSNHSGTAHFGHYTAWAKHYATQEWYEFDDRRVSKLSSSHPITKSTVHSTKPYVLFYRKANASDH